MKVRTIWFATHGSGCTPAARESLASVGLCFYRVALSEDEEIDDQVWKDCARSISHRPHRPPTGSGPRTLSDTLARTVVAWPLASDRQDSPDGSGKVNYKCEQFRMNFGRWHMFLVAATFDILHFA